MKKIISYVLLASLFSLVNFVFAETDNSNQSSYSYLNSQRQLAGMTSFSVSPPLAKSSYNHGVYLANHKIMSHYQTNKKASFLQGNRQLIELIILVGNLHEF